MKYFKNTETFTYINITCRTNFTTQLGILVRIVTQWAVVAFSSSFASFNGCRIIPCIAFQTRRTLLTWLKITMRARGTIKTCLCHLMVARGARVTTFTDFTLVLARRTTVALFLTLAFCFSLVRNERSRAMRVCLPCMPRHAVL